MSEVEQLSLRRFNALWKQYARRSRAPPQDRGVVAWFVRLLRHGQEGGDAARARSRRAREVEEYKQGGSRQLYEGQLSLEDAVLFVCDLRALLGLPSDRRTAVTVVNNVRKMSVNGDGRVFEYPSALFALFFLQSTGGASNLSQSLQMQKDHLTDGAEIVDHVPEQPVMSGDVRLENGAVLSFNTLGGRGLSYKAQFVGAIPRPLAMMRGLFSIHIDNITSSDLHPSILACSQLEALALNGGALESIEGIEEMRSLRTLRITRFPQMKTVPEGICSLEHLEQLTLQCLAISNIPSRLDKCKKLEILAVGNNNIELLPFSVGFAENLKSVILRGNPIMCIPPSMARLKKLNTLTLDWDRFGVVPTQGFARGYVTYVPGGWNDQAYTCLIRVLKSKENKRWFGMKWMPSNHLLFPRTLCDVVETLIMCAYCSSNSAILAIPMELWYLVIQDAVHAFFMDADYLAMI